MEDSKSQYLNLPLPDPINTLEVDVQRLIKSFLIIDSNTKQESEKLQQQTDLVKNLIKNIENLELKLEKKIDDINQASLNMEKNFNDQFLKVFPKKSILLFSGSLNEIPNGWAICDGENGTPDLTNKFILGAGKNTNVGATGGSLNHKHDITGTVHNHTLTTAQMPSHNHFYRYGIHNMAIGPHSFAITPSGQTLMPDTIAGGNEAHNHGFNAAASDEANVPPYYALAYIMKL